MPTTQYIGARYVPLFAEPTEWNNTRTYEPLTIVINEGNSYTSKQYVPKGIDISNEAFWVLTGNYNAQVEAYRKAVKRLESEVDYEVERATKAEETLTQNLQSEIERATKAEETLTQNLQSEVYPEMFGAKGDGVTDDTEAIQAAFNQAAIYGKAVSFKPYATYRVNPSAHKVATNGSSKIEFKYGAIVLTGKKVVINGNGSTIKSTISQTQYDANDPTIGAVLLVCSATHNDSEVGKDNTYSYAEYGQSIKITNLIIDGDSEHITQNKINWAAGKNNLSSARGISSINQNFINIELNNVSIINTVAEGMSGGGTYTSLYVRGGYYKNNFPTALNISGTSKIIDGAVIENKFLYEGNPTYNNSVEIIRNCVFNCDYPETIIITSNLLSEVSNSTTFFTNNIINIDHLTGSHGILALKNKQVYMTDNVFNIKTNTYASTTGFVLDNCVKDFNNVYRFSWDTKIPQFGFKYNNVVSNNNSIIYMDEISNSDLWNYYKVPENYSVNMKFSVPANSTNIIYRYQKDLVRKLEISATNPVVLNNVKVVNVLNSSSTTRTRFTADSLTVGLTPVTISLISETTSTSSLNLTANTTESDNVFDCVFYL